MRLKSRHVRKPKRRLREMLRRKLRSMLQRKQHRKLPGKLSAKLQKKQSRRLLRISPYLSGNRRRLLLSHLLKRLSMTSRNSLEKTISDILLFC